MVLSAKCWQNYGKTNSLNENDLAEFVKMVKTKELSDNSWLLDMATVNNETWDLNVNNPNIVEEVDNRTHSRNNRRN